MGFVAQMPPAAHHGEVYAGFAALDGDGQYVYIFVAVGVDGLLVQHFVECAHLVADFGCLLKCELL